MPKQDDKETIELDALITNLLSDANTHKTNWIAAK